MVKDFGESSRNRHWGIKNWEEERGCMSCVCHPLVQVEQKQNKSSAPSILASVRLIPVLPRGVIQILSSFVFLHLVGTALAETQSVVIPDTGWSVWLDKGAKWKDEAIYFPGEASIAAIQARPPTPGWEALSGAGATVVTLPTTVEQHFWGTDGLRPYQNEYFYEGQDKVPRNGNYLGVSWWWRNVDVPTNFVGKSVFLHIRAAKQRAEVYVNRQLVGYQLIGESAFDCDVSKAIQPGKPNMIAIRITNPGGRLDWGDWSFTSLGGKGFFAGHAFGGLDRGLTLSAHGSVRISDAWVLNTPDPKTIFPHIRLERSGGESLKGWVDLAVVDSATHLVVARDRIPVASSAGNEVFSKKITIPNAKLWSPDHPSLYRLRFTYVGATSDTKETTFGCRWFGPDGVGSNAVLRLNGERIRVFSAISWGFWGINGLWPTPALAEKEVRVAKSLGLNSINFHRNMPRTEALDAADRLGLLRYAEPGGGMTLFWNKDIVNDSTQRYMTEKILAMVRDHRSHPSITFWVVQNELGDDGYQHAIAEKILRAIHEEDPSRAAVLKSGIPTKGQMWLAPYDDMLHVDKGDGYSGWADEHTVGTPDAWTDDAYKSPNEYVYRNTNQKEIVDYGEMGGSGTADNHALMLGQIANLGGKSYDKIDHQEIDDAYGKFLDQFGFRSAFPQNARLYQAIGAKQYDYWRNVIQCARLSDASDYLTISGWETTAIENHSGLVDALRNPHGDPAWIAGALRPVLPALQLRKSSVLVGGSVTYDLFFLNETNTPVHGNLVVTLHAPDASVKVLGSFPIPKFEKDIFSYAVKAGLETPALTQVGKYNLIFSAVSGPGKTISESRSIRVVDLPKLKLNSIGMVGGDSQILSDLKELGLGSELYDKAKTYPLIICTSEQSGTAYSTETPATGTADPELYKVQHYGNPGEMSLRFGNLPDGTAKVTLGFSEPYFQTAGGRVFDVEVNGSTALHDVDIAAIAGGKDRVWTTTIETQTINGRISIGPGQVKKDHAAFNTIRIDIGGKTFAYYFGGKPHTAKDGTVWLPYQPFVGLDPSVLEKVRAGTSLLVISTDDDVTTQYATALASAGAFKFEGLVGRSFAPWMGSWYFVRAHPLYAGLPVNTVMKGDYQVGVGSSNGIVVSGSNVELVTGYSKDHSRLIGAGDVVTKVGNGEVIFHTVPRMIHPYQLRWLANAIQFASSR
jgi:hypothetical protein